MPAASYEDVQDGAGMPPATLPLGESKGRAGVVLYVFRVPGGKDLCFSFAKPTGDQVTDLDVFLALYYVRAGADGTMMLVRRGQAVARVEGWVVELLSWGYLKFGATVANDGEACLLRVVEKDPKGVTAFASPWGTSCKFDNGGSSISSNSTIKCFHQLPGPSSTTISELKLKLKSKLLEKGRLAAAKSSQSTTTASPPSLPPPLPPPHHQKAPSVGSAYDLASADDVFGSPASETQQQQYELQAPAGPITTRDEHEEKRKSGARITPISEISPLFAYLQTPPALPPRRPPIAPEDSPSQKAASGAQPPHPLPPTPTIKGLIKRKPIAESNKQSIAGPARAELPRAVQAAQVHIENPARPSIGERGISLGREALGGGRMGKQAKLAKLTVFAEGQYMLDLVVAANLVVFFDYYDSDK